MAEFIRRSYLVISPLDRQVAERAWMSNPDAIVLDLHGVPEGEKAEARARIKGLVPFTKKGGAQGFVHCSQNHLAADLDAAIWPGLKGILLSHPESALDVTKAEGALSQLEEQRGIDAGSLEMVVFLGSAKGLMNVREIITASRRVTTAGLDEESIIADLGILPDANEDPLKIFARGRIVVEGAGIDEFVHGRHGVYRIGLGYKLSVFPNLQASEEEILISAKEAKENGFSGGLCLDPSWVSPVNQGFTPTDDEVAHHKAVRETYAAGIAIGRGAVPFKNGEFVERPFDELAKKVIGLRVLSDQRDAEKAVAKVREGLA